jgi:hypothetical protein
MDERLEFAYCAVSIDEGKGREGAVELLMCER